MNNEKIKEIINNDRSSFAAMAYKLGRKEATIELTSGDRLEVLIKYSGKGTNND